MVGDIETTIAKLLSPLLHTEGFELVAVEIAGNSKNQILRLLIHKHEGLSVADCKTVDQIVRPILEVHQILEKYKQFEIASPGVDRPLKNEADFRRNIGRTVQIKLTTNNTQHSKVKGQLIDIVEGCVVLEQTSGKTIHIKISQICEGYIQLNW